MAQLVRMLVHEIALGDQGSVYRHRRRGSTNAQACTCPFLMCAFWRGCWGEKAAVGTDFAHRTAASWGGGVTQEHSRVDLSFWTLSLS